MQTELNEYIPSPTEHRKKFDIVPSQDPVDLTAIKARTQCLRDHRISYGARCLFCFLLDQALNPYVHVARGVVAISATRLAEYLGCYEKSIFPWIRQLIAARHIWMDHQYMPSFWAMNRYHIMAFDPQDGPSQLPTRDGMWGNGSRQPTAPDMTGVPSVGKFEKRVPVAKTTCGNSVENLQLIQNQRVGSGNSTPDASSKLHAAHVEKPHPSDVEKPDAAHVEKPHPSDVEKPHGGHVENATPRVVKPTHIRESQLQSERRKQSSKSISKGVKPGLRREAELYVQRMAVLACEHDGEKAGMLQLKNFRKQWQARYYEDADKSNRVFAEVSSAAREARITGKVGEYYNHIWKEFAGKKGVAK